jgi:hypothetical protein
MSALSHLQGHAKNLEIRVKNLQIQMDEHLRCFQNAHMLQVLDNKELIDVRLAIEALEKQE